MDGLIAHDAWHAAIIVMPDGANGQWYDSLNGELRNEEYVRTGWSVRRSTPPYDRGAEARAIVGVSNGGYGAMFSRPSTRSLRAAGGMSSTWTP